MRLEIQQLFNCDFYLFQIALGPPDKAKWYHMIAGRKNYVDNLKTFFPEDHEAINKFMSIVDVSSIEIKWANDVETTVIQRYLKVHNCVP